MLSTVTEMSGAHLLEEDPFVHDPQLANVRSIVYRPNEILPPSYLPLVSDNVLFVICDDCVYVFVCTSNVTNTVTCVHTRMHTLTHTHIHTYSVSSSSLAFH